MRYRNIMVFLLLINLGFIYAQDLSEYQWKNRIVLLMDADKKLEQRRLQLKKFQESSEEVEERDLIILVYTGDSLLNDLGYPMKIDLQTIPSRDFQGVLLIGKDGGIKYSNKFVVEPQLIFERIDSMPMRKAEMKQ